MEFLITVRTRKKLTELITYLIYGIIIETGTYFNRMKDCLFCLSEKYNTTSHTAHRSYDIV